MNRKKINFYVPEGITGKQFEKFLKRSRLNFISPKKKEKVSRDVEMLHNGLHSAIITAKYNKGLLTKI